MTIIVKITAKTDANNPTAYRIFLRSVKSFLVFFQYSKISKLLLIL